MSPTRYSGLRIAIVGFGPAGGYAATHLLGNSGLDVTVDVIERLPTPWGLVRSGVAPDHPHIKAVTRVWEKAAEDPALHFVGNLDVGRHVSRAELLARYHAVIYAVGAQSAQSMRVPGEDLPGSASATSFVGWYNGHPAFRDEQFDLSCRRAVVIGNGNVALDVARMLSLPPAQLARTDIADHALAALARSRISEVVVVGRRGPEQAAFTNPELRELGRAEGLDIDVDPGEIAVPEHLRERQPSLSGQRNTELLRTFADRERSGQPRRIALRFLLSPTRILGEGRVEAIELARNALERTPDGGLRATPTSARATIPAGLVLRAIGYRGEPIPGVPFDERRGLIAQTDGRVLGDDGRPTREYVVGWAKRGPDGVVGTNKRCAQDTVRALLQDLVSGRLSVAVPAAASTRAFLESRSPRPVSLADWRTIDAYEQQRGEPAGRPRVKLTRVQDMLAVLDEQRRLAA